MWSRWALWLGLALVLGCGPLAKALFKVGAKGGAKTAVTAGGAKAVKVGAAAAGAEAVGASAVRVERAAVVHGAELGDDAARAAGAVGDDGARTAGAVGDDGARAARSEGAGDDLAETAVDVAAEVAGDDDE